VLEFCVRANIGVFKSIAPQPIHLLRELKAALPNCKFIYRPYFETQPLDNPTRRAHEAVDAAMSHLSQFPYDYTELYNETGLWDEAYDYITFTVEAAQLLETQGQKLLAYSFAWGNPCGFVSDPYNNSPAQWMEGLREHWAPYCEGLRWVQVGGGGLALHQYKIPATDDKFSILRHRLVREILPNDLKDIPIWLTEFGLDHKANPDESGWKGHSWGWSPAKYALWLSRMASRIGDEVAGAAIFGCGMPGWWSFDILGYPVIADTIAQVNEEEEVKEPIRVLNPAGMVVTLELEEYLRGVLPKEVYSYWPIETLKAQAVAARTYAKRAMKYPRHGLHADVCAGPHCQAWRPRHYIPTDEAVGETVGLFLLDPLGTVYLSQYVSRCGLDICPYCQGQSGYDGKQWSGRMCQWGAKVFGDKGMGFRGILKHYYPDATFSDKPDPTEELHKQISDMKADIQTLANKWR